MSTVTRTYVAEFGPRYSGLAAVGYTLTGGTRTTTGVAESPAGSGIYQATVTHDAALVGTITWDTGQTPDRYAVETIYPVAPGTPSGGTTPLDQLGAAATALSGAVAGPAEVEGDAGRARQQPLPDLIAAHKYLAAVAGVTSRFRGLRISKLLPSGTVGRAVDGDPRDVILPPTFDRL